MYHYTYLIVFPDGKMYIGARSTLIKPELDTLYLGSGRYLPERTPQTCTKHILGLYDSRHELIQAEIDLIDLNNAVNSEQYYNKRRKVYDKFGLTTNTCEGVALTTSKLTGRTKETHEYIRQANIKRSSYSGSNRTPAQIEGQKRCAETIRGTTNPLKACKGVDNGGFNPWYYIKPDGTRIEVWVTPKQDYAHLLGLTPRQLGHRFHHTNIGKPGKTGKTKGWVFGNIETDKE